MIITSATFGGSSLAPLILIGGRMAIKSAATGTSGSSKLQPPTHSKNIRKPFSSGAQFVQKRNGRLGTACLHSPHLGITAAGNMHALTLRAFSPCRSARCHIIAANSQSGRSQGGNSSGTPQALVAFASIHAAHPLLRRVCLPRIAYQLLQRGDIVLVLRRHGDDAAREWRWLGLPLWCAGQLLQASIVTAANPGG